MARDCAALGPVVLEGAHIRLEPVEPAHLDGLLAVAQDPRIWPWMSQNLSHRPTLARWLTDALREQIQGTAYVFAVMDRASGQVLGSTRYMDVSASQRGAEIGWTWYTPRVWGTRVNPEAKLLLLRHAFEDWGAIRVQLKTDHLNRHSQAAIVKLGARYEGTLRNHRIRPDGTIRHTVMYSIVPEEWPAVRDGLERRLVKAPDGPEPARS
jgi:RimJ/RimL family protein N-acetyltransferase